jgi:hypothetical protein
LGIQNTLAGARWFDWSMHRDAPGGTSLSWQNEKQYCAKGRNTSPLKLRPLSKCASTTLPRTCIQNSTFTNFYFQWTNVVLRTWHSIVSTVTRLQAGQFGVRMATGERDLSLPQKFRPTLVATRPPTTWVPGALPLGVQQQGHVADHIHLLTRWRKSEATPPLPLHAFMACTGTNLPFNIALIPNFCRQNFLGICVILFSTSCCVVLVSRLYWSTQHLAPVKMRLRKCGWVWHIWMKPSSVLLCAPTAHLWDCVQQTMHTSSSFSTLH